jgi:hypothetical protein
VDSAFIARKKQQRESATGGAGGEVDMEDLYDADELDDQFATQQDKILATTDIPERLQVKIGE